MTVTGFLKSCLLVPKFIGTRSQQQLFGQLLEKYEIGIISKEMQM